MPHGPIHRATPVARRPARIASRHVARMCPTLPQRLSIPRIDRKDRWSIEGGKAIIAAAEAAADQEALETVEEISDPEPSTNAAPMGAGAVEGRPITPTNMS